MVGGRCCWIWSSRGATLWCLRARRQKADCAVAEGEALISAPEVFEVPLQGALRGQEKEASRPSPAPR